MTLKDPDKDMSWRISEYKEKEYSPVVLFFLLAVPMRFIYFRPSLFVL